MAFLDMIKEDAERVLANTDEFGIAISYTPYKGSAISTSAVPVGFAPDKDNTTPRGQIKITLWHIPRSKVTARPVEDGDSFTEGGRTHVVKEIVDDRDPAMWTVRTS